MTRDRWARIKDIFGDAIDRHGTARLAFLAQACADDPTLRAEVDRLVREHEFADAFLLPTSDPAARAHSTFARPLRIGCYEIIDLLGEGGMGVVYLARQDTPRRNVALKVIRPGFISPQTLRRFENEAQILGRLRHSGIAQIYDAGSHETSDGTRPYFVMEYIQGRPLLDYVTERNLSVKDRLELVARIADAVQHAHQHGVIHRDLKPSNILVAEADSQPKILDFGIARVTEPGMQLTTIHTGAGQLLGTLAYMSPEQIVGDPNQIDTRADVYSLGVVLYEVLCGRLPFVIEGRSFIEAARLIRENDPVRISQVNRALGGDVETIVLKTLSRDKARRYTSAAELASDLRRCQNHEPISARPPTPGYQLRIFARRNKALVGGVVAVFVVLLLGIAGMGWQWSRAVAQRNRAIEAEREAENRTAQVVNVATDIMRLVEDSLSDLPGGTRACEVIAQEALTQLSALPRNYESIEPTHASIPYLLAYAQHRVGEVTLAMGRTGEALSHFREALALRKELVQRHPTYDVFVKTLGVGHWKVAEALIRQGELREASEHLEEALGIHERIIGLHKGNAPGNSGVYLGGGHRRIAELTLLSGNAPAAIGSFRKSLELVDADLSRAPGILNLRRGKASSLRGLGEALLAEGRHAEAIVVLRESLEVIDGLYRESVTPRLWDLSNLALASLWLSKALAASGDCVQALTHVQRACELAERLSGDDPASFDSLLLLARCRSSLGEVRWQCQAASNAALELDSAIAIFEKLVRAAPDSPEVRHDFVLALICRSRCHASQSTPTTAVCARTFLDRALAELELLRSSCFPPAVLAPLEDRLKLAMQSESLARTP